MAEEEEKKKFNFKKIALFGIGPIALVGIGIGVGAFLFMPTQTPVEQVEQLIEKSFNRPVNYQVLLMMTKVVTTPTRFIKTLQVLKLLLQLIILFQIILPLTYEARKHFYR